MPEATERSRALMFRITREIWDEGHIDLVDELIAEDLIDHVDLPGLEGAGRDRYRASVEMMRAAFPDFRNPLDLVVAEDDFAVSYGRMTGTHLGELMGVPATGKRFDVPVFGILRFVDDEAVERWGLADFMGLTQQLGLMA